MNMRSFINLIIAVFFITTFSIPVHALIPSQVFDKVKDSVVVHWLWKGMLIS